MYVMPRSASSGLVETNGMARPGPDLLTSREAGVLELLQEGRTNAEIAHELSIGIETVRTHAATSTASSVSPRGVTWRRCRAPSCTRSAVVYDL